MTSPVIPASRWRRIIAWWIDATLVPGFTFFLVMVTGVVEDAEDYTSNWWMLWVLLLAIVSYLILNGYLLWQSGQTIGKRIMRISIVSVSGQAISFWKLVLVRAWFFPMPFLLPLWPITVLVALNYLPIFWRTRRCAHDWLSQSVVTHTKEETQ